MIKGLGGEIVHENPWGLKSLAYPIQKKTTGLYWVMEYKAPSAFNEQAEDSACCVTTMCCVTCSLYSINTPSSTMKEREVVYHTGTEKAGRDNTMAKANEIKYLTAIKTEKAPEEILSFQEIGYQVY